MSADGFHEYLRRIAEKTIDFVLDLSTIGGETGGGGGRLPHLFGRKVLIYAYIPSIKPLNECTCNLTMPKVGGP